MEPLSLLLSVSVSAPPPSLSIPALAVRSMQDLQDQFPSLSIPSCFSPSSNHIFLGFPTDLSPSGIFLNTIFTVLSSGILPACRKHHNLPFLISEVSLSPYRSINIWLMRILHTSFWERSRCHIIHKLWTLFSPYVIAMQHWSDMWCYYITSCVGIANFVETMSTQGGSSQEQINITDTGPEKSLNLLIE